MTYSIKSRKLVREVAMLTFVAGVHGVIAAPAAAQTLTGITTNFAVVCVGTAGILGVAQSQDTCDTSEGLYDAADGFEVGNASFDATNPQTSFTGGTVSFNSVTTAFGGGSASFNNTVTFTGPSVSFQTDVDFDSTIDTTGIDNTGFILTDALLATGIGTGNLSVASQLSVTSGATINMGDNIIHGVAGGVADTDAVNVAQLVAATSGITTDITALETTSAAHTTQIADLQTTTATHSTQIAAVEAVNTTQSSQITAIEAVNTIQSTQIAAVEAVNTTQSTQIAAVEAVNTTQTSQITAIEAVNTTQSSQISALEAAVGSIGSDIDTLFDLRSHDRRDMKQGVAAAMSMASAPMPSEPGRISYAVNGATFRGEYAVGGSLMYRLPTRAPMAVNVGFSYAGNKNNGVRVGVAGEF